MTPAYDDRGEQLERQIVAECVQNPQSNAAWQAFADHFGFYIHMWIHHSMRGAPAQDREDAYQNLMIKIYKDGVLARIDPDHPSPRAFLRRVTRNFIIDEHRREPVKPASLDRDESLADALGMLADGFPPKSEDDLLKMILDHLASTSIDERRLAVYDAFLDSRPASEIAERVGISLATAYRYRAELLEIFRSVLGVP